MISLERQRSTPSVSQFPTSITAHLLYESGASEHFKGKIQPLVVSIGTKIENNVRSVLSAVGVKHANNPKKLSFVKPKERAEKDQLVLDFSGSGNGR